MRYWIGSSPCRQNSLQEVQLAEQLDAPIIAMAAMATPICEPMPPSTTMARMIADSMKTKDSGRDEALPRGEEAAGEAAEHRADGEGGELGVGRVDAERAAGDLVLAQRLPGAADRQAAQAHGDEVGEQRQRQDHVVEEDVEVDAVEFEAEEAAKPSSLRIERQAEEGCLGTVMPAGRR